MLALVGCLEHVSLTSFEDTQRYQCADSTRISTYLKLEHRVSSFLILSVAQMGEAACVGTSLDFVSARPTFKRLQLVYVAVERMRRPPGYVHRPSTRWASRPMMRNLICISMI
jgi:hypothetical protein